AGMYICALVQVGLFTDIGSYTAAYGGEMLRLSFGDYFFGLGLGLIAAALGCVVFAYILGITLFGLRGAYFAIGTLGIALAAGELIGAWQWVGGGGGIALPIFPGEPDQRSRVYYMLCFGSAVATFIVVRFLYSTRFGLAINAIRDDESKAEAMGIHTMRHKNFAWAVSAFFLGISGGIFGNITGFVEPLEVAFPTVTFGIFMVAMSLLGGKGTLWGPILGAVLFHTIKELTWTLFLGWQWVLLGLLIIINVVFFQQGIMGWLMEKRPEWFGRVIDSERETTGAPQ
ncbi:MAG: branched-chain amino acid ABC transporter permease, partial [Proteobacteria bacterium]|nr:branched-chain amino acid ABC transporter permease [Pseudomonadota bacterium]